MKPNVKEDGIEEDKNKNDYEDEEDYYKFYDYQNEDLNQLEVDELKRRKDEMDKLYQKNAVLPGDQNFQYDVRVYIYLF